MNAPILRLLTLLAFAALLASGPARAQDQTTSRAAAIEAMYPVMIQALESGNFGQARNIIDQIIAWEPLNPVHHYNLACIEARTGGERQPLAFESLERAIALGFDDLASLHGDPDLSSLRSTPRFKELLATVTRALNAGPVVPAPPATARGQESPAQPAPPPASPAPRAATVQPLAPTSAAPPADASITRGVPVGLYFMTRPSPAEGVTEEFVWYFAPDGAVYQCLEEGFSSSDLAGHGGRKGRARARGDQLEITWTDGTKVAAPLRKERAGGFTWHGGRFVPAAAYASSSAIAGRYEGYKPVSYGGNRAALGQVLELRADGTFSWTDVSFQPLNQENSLLAVAMGPEDAEGSWRLDGYNLVLRDREGVIYRRIVFPRAGEGDGEMFFGGVLYRRLRDGDFARSAEREGR